MIATHRRMREGLGELGKLDVHVLTLARCREAGARTPDDLRRALHGGDNELMNALVRSLGELELAILRRVLLTEPKGV